MTSHQYLKLENRIHWELSTDPAAIIEVINWIAPPGCRYWKYHRKFNEFLSTLERERQDLSNRMETIQQRLNGELRYHKVTNKEVESWLRKIEDKFRKGNYFLRGWRGKHVDEKIQEVKRVYDQGVFPAGLVIDAPDDIGLPLPTLEMVGEDSVKEFFLKHLMGDKVRKIGVCGMVGVGKTTITKHIHNQLLKERNKFGKVIWATVSKEYVIVKLQQDIATALGEDLSKHNDITMRAAVLQEMLKGKKKYMLILDDVWKPISLEQVGIPEPTLMDGIREMPDGILPKLLRLQYLRLDNAVAEAEEVSRLSKLECLGIRFRNLQELKKGKSGRNWWTDKLESSLLKKVSIDGCPKLKRLFPPKLLRNLQNLEEIEVSWCSGLVEIVEASSDEEEEDKEASKNSFKPSLPNLRSITLCDLPDLRSFCKSCYAIHCDSLRSICIVRCPKLKTISPLFPQPDNGQPFPPASLENLTVYPIECWNSLEWDHPNTKNVLERFPQSTAIVNFLYVPSLAKLGALKKLDLGQTSITAIPDGLEMLVHLRYLDLYANGIKEMPGGILPKLFRLQYLRLDNAVAEVEEVSRLSKLECLGIRFRNLQEYHIYFSLKQQRCLNYYSFNSVGMGDYILEGRREKAVGIRGLTNFGDSIKIPTDIKKLVIQRCDDLRRVSDISSLKDATDWRTCWIHSCKQIECFYYLSSYRTALQTLQYLALHKLDNLISILGEEIDGARSALPTPITPGIFFCLKKVSIEGCPKLKRLFPPKLLRNLQNLEDIHVTQCLGLVEIVIASSDEEEGKEASKNSIKLSLPNLRSIFLQYLPELRSFCKSCYAIHCDSLRSIYIEGCPKLKTISPLFPQPDNGQPFRPASLERLIVGPKERWNSLEWDHPNTKNVLEPFLWK
ncbi:probable disease resistance protein At4g27220 [Pistacia vera]|uniref:probable disease resistance protein At4g27220 n=1 Tax=Pistacia vera TaxID=55513 RepID=UPI0012630457|nr:probable disease resistance protein At4g27220 [Pistacia vera]